MSDLLPGDVAGLKLLVKEPNLRVELPSILRLFANSVASKRRPEVSIVRVFVSLSNVPLCIGCPSACPESTVSRNDKFAWGRCGQIPSQAKKRTFSCFLSVLSVGRSMIISY